MDTIIPFPKAALAAKLNELRQQLAQLDAKEPKNMNSDAYGEWADAHEKLEDAIDDILDELDELP